MKILSTGNLVMGRPCCFNNGQFRISAYNFQCRMTSQTDIDGSEFAYEFDGEGNRLSQSLNDCLSKRFVYDGADVLLELNPTNGVAYAWVNGPGIDQPIERLLFIDGPPRARRVFHADALGSIAALTDPNGLVTQSYNYSAFGSLRHKIGPDPNRITYTAREQLGDSQGWLFYRHRVYSPNMARFLSADPLRFADGANIWRYVFNNPFAYVDPFGLEGDSLRDLYLKLGEGGACRAFSDQKEKLPAAHSVSPFNVLDDLFAELTEWLDVRWVQKFSYARLKLNRTDQRLLFSFRLLEKLYRHLGLRYEIPSYDDYVPLGPDGRRDGFLYRNSEGKIH